MKSDMTTRFTQCSSRWLRGYGFPVVASLLIHAVALGLMVVQWSSPPPLMVPPANIKASLVPPPDPVVREVEDKVAIEGARKAAQEKAAQEKVRRQQEQQRKVQEEAERQKQIALKKQQEAQVKKAAEDARRKEQQRQEALAREREAQKKREQDALKKKLAAEQAARVQKMQAEAEQAAKDAIEVSHYSTVLTKLVSQTWNRPLSARNGMTTTIEIRLSPFGQLQGYKIIKGSGNDAFDGSVVQAIKLAAPFVELKSLDRRIFDRYFRRITIRFSPEDLIR